MGMAISELMSLYDDADSHHQALFAEQRSNLLLVAGNHYNKKDSRFYQRIREMENISKSQRLRLVKNHVQRITKGYRNNILMFSPGVKVGPKNEHELSDQKVAELHNSVWADLKERHKLNALRTHLVQDFVNIGELICKVFYDENAGRQVGEEPIVDEDGNVVVDEETGEPYMRPKFSGDLVYERIQGFNLLSDPDARSPMESRWYCYRKMLPVKDLQAQFEDDDTKLAWITESSEETYKIFDSSSGKYADSDGLCMVMEWYFRPCAEYRNGWYAMTLKGGILAEGELPLGLFPIIYKGFDELDTSARAASLIRQLRPYQAEVNRAASKIGEHQITLGDDKVFLMNGSSMEPGGTAHGVKAIRVTGQEPKIMGGRTGEQYVGYMNGQIDEMYRVANYEEDKLEADTNGQIDPYTLLFKTAAKKKRYSIYIEKVQEAMKEICELSLRFAKAFYPDEMLVPVIGKKEMVNIPEFRATDDLSYQISFEALTDDLESKLGRQLSLNHLIQYAGQKMQGKDLGRVVKAMEYVNKDMLFDDETIDYENATNDILALDRGEQVQVSRSDDAAYMAKRLKHRIKKRDFRALSPQIQQNYHQLQMQYEGVLAEQIKQAQLAQSGFVPSGGMLISCDFYQENPKGPQERPVRVRVPSEALQWLLDKLKSQGASQEMLQAQELSTQASVAQLMQRQNMQQLPAPVPQVQPAGSFY